MASAMAALAHARVGRAGEVVGRQVDLVEDAAADAVAPHAEAADLWGAGEDVGAVAPGAGIDIGRQARVERLRVLHLGIGGQARRAVVDARVAAQHRIGRVGRHQFDLVGAVEEGGDDAAVVRAIPVVGGQVARPAARGDHQRQLLQRVGSAIGIVGRAADERGHLDAADILVLGLLHQDDIGAVQVADDLVGDAAQVRLIRLGAGRHVVERRVDAGAAAVADEVAAVERVVAEVVEVLDVVGGDAVLAAAVEGGRRRVAGGVHPGAERQLLLDHDLILVEGDVDAADRRVGQGVEGARGRQQDRVVVAGRLDAQAAGEDAVAVAVVEQLRRPVVERVRVAEDAPRVGVGPLGNGVVAADEPDLGVGRAGEDIAPIDDDAAGRQARPRALAPLPVAVGRRQVVGRVRVEGGHLGVEIDAAPHQLDQAGRGQLGEVEELGHPRAEDHLVAHHRHVAADEAGEGAHEDEDAVRGGRVAVGRGGRVLDEEAVLGGAGRGAGQRLLVDDALHGDEGAAAAVAAGWRVRRADGAAVGGVGDRALDRADRQDHRHRRRRDGRGRRRAGVRDRAARRQAEAVEGILGEAVPLDGGVEGIGRHGVAGLDRALAAQGVVGGAGQPAAPLRARIDPELADRVDDDAGPLEHDRVVAVEPAGAVGLIGLGQDGRVGAGLGQHVDIAGRHRAGEGDGQPGGGVAVEEHLDRVAAGRQIDGRAGAVVDLQRLVVAGALDVLGEEELGRRGGGWPAAQPGRQHHQQRQRDPDQQTGDPTRHATSLPVALAGGMLPRHTCSMPAARQSYAAAR
jgi:hypothetical protein